MVEKHSQQCYKNSEKKVPLCSSDVSMSHIISQMLVSHTLKTVMLSRGEKKKKIYIYIYIEREREREICKPLSFHMKFLLSTIIWHWHLAFSLKYDVLFAVFNDITSK